MNNDLKAVSNDQRVLTIALKDIKRKKKLLNFFILVGFYVLRKS